MSIIIWEKPPVWCHQHGARCSCSYIQQ